MQVVIAVCLWLAVAAALALCIQFRGIRNAWREPSLGHPVLILESDDWGPGPMLHAERLNALTQILRRFRDTQGCHPVLTLGVVLAVPSESMQNLGSLEHYERTTLAEARFEHIRQVMRRGVESQVFSLQLHGMEHFWPHAILAASRTNQTVQQWLISEDYCRTEDLPPALQSRWIDASSLPSKQIPEKWLREAAVEEVRVFAEVFGQIAKVAVPPTFVWNLEVEKAWREEGVQIVITPGTRNEARDEQGTLIPAATSIFNGQLSPSGLTYLVRDAYFEPTKGHRAADGLAALERKTRLGRPTLLEMHRFNFVRDQGAAEHSLNELRRLLEGALARYPDLRFLSAEELASALAARDPALVETRFSRRIFVWLLRLYDISRLRKLAWVTGLILPGTLVYVILRRLSGTLDQTAQGTSS